jgi:hypothetical protein
VLKEGLSVSEKLLRLYLMKKGNTFKEQLKSKIELLYNTVSGESDEEAKLISEDFIYNIIKDELNDIPQNILLARDNKITKDALHDEVRSVVLFFIDIINKTKSTEYYDKYNHTLIKFVETAFVTQNSSINEMIQHGITIHKDFAMDTNSGGTR